MVLLLVDLLGQVGGLLVVDLVVDSRLNNLLRLLVVELVRLYVDDVLLLDEGVGVKLLLRKGVGDEYLLLGETVLSVGDLGLGRWQDRLLLVL